jgi:hypothetical protein
MMQDKKIYYTEGYKYQLFQTYQTTTRITPKFPVTTEYIQLDTAGNLTINEGYAWDGPSGPTIDTSDSMRASLEHDAKYQLFRESLLHQNWRATADEEFREVCIEDGMTHLRADAWYIMVREFAESAANPDNDKPVLEAP